MTDFALIFGCLNAHPGTHLVGKNGMTLYALVGERNPRVAIYHGDFRNMTVDQIKAYIEQKQANADV